MKLSRSLCDFTLFLIVSGVLYLAEVADCANEFRRCYNTSVEMHCFDLQYDTTNSRWLTASVDNARQRCNDLQSTLVIIKDEEINNIVQNYISDPYNPQRFQNVWTDAYRVSDYSNSYTWHWVNSALPNVPASEVSIYFANAWYTASLEFRIDKSQFHLTAQQPHFTNSYICEYAVSRCPSTGSNSRLIADRCYIAVNASLPWYEARNRCLKEGGDLASFTNVTSIDFTSWLPSDQTVRYWIGLRFSWYIWNDSGLDVKFAKWILDNDWSALCLVVCYNCYPSFSWLPKSCDTMDPIYVVCHSVTPLHATTRTTTSAINLPVTASSTFATQTGDTQSNSAGSNSSKNEKSAESSRIALAVGVGVGAGVPVLVAIIIIAICVVRSKTSVEKKTRSDTTELGAVQKPSVGQVNESTNDQYEQLNRNLDSSSGPMYDELRVAPEAQYEEFPPN